MILKTERLEVRHLTETDERCFEELLSNPRVMEYSFAAPMNALESISYLQTAIDSYDEYGYGIYALSKIDSVEMIGYCGFTQYDDLDSENETELGYRLFPQYWGEGYATEAASALLEYGRRELNFGRVISLIRADNAASTKVAEKSGAVFEKSIETNGFRALVYVY